MELSRRMIPYEIRSGVRFFEQAHIKDVIAYLKIMTNPRDELSWKRVLKLYPTIGEKTASDAWGHISRDRDHLGSFPGEDHRQPPHSKGGDASLRSLASVFQPLSGGS